MLPEQSDPLLAVSGQTLPALVLGVVIAEAVHQIGDVFFLPVFDEPAKAPVQRPAHKPRHPQNHQNGGE